MKSWTPPTKEILEKALSTVKKETDRQYFFSKLKNPLWVAPLNERGYFNSPPGMKLLPDGYVQYPFWPELIYLTNVVSETPKEVIQIINSLPRSDNPRIYDGILEMALRLKGEESAKLYPKLAEYVALEHQFLAHRYSELLQHWSQQGNIKDALEIIRSLIEFKPDPNYQQKVSKRTSGSPGYGTSLQPVPRLSDWDYKHLLEEGISPLIEKAPLEVALILIDTLGRLIRMSKRPDDLENEMEEDYSEVWCRRLDEIEDDYQEPREMLVHTLTRSCERVYEALPEKVEVLDQALRSYRWKIFKRLREHLYSLHPTKTTFPWIRELVVNHDGYSKWEYHYEFQLMLRNAVAHFRDALLRPEELEAILASIMEGPSDKDFREWLGASYTDELFVKRKREFHRAQLHPFIPILNKKFTDYVAQLDANSQRIITDETYSPYSGVSGGTVTYKSPKDAEALQEMGDEELMTYINSWEDERHDNDNWLVEINIRALADVFQAFFRERINLNDQRLNFWIGNRDRIARPVYVAAMVRAIQEVLKERRFDKLETWVEFCAWVLSHQDPDRADGAPKLHEESRLQPDWRSSRRAVVDVIETCLDKSVDVPISTRGQFANLLKTVCLQFDWRLDRNHPVLLNKDDPLAEAINSIRGRALDALIQFGFWVQRHTKADPQPELTEILSIRFRDGEQVALKRPELALLGRHFRNLCALNTPWATDYKNHIFRREPAETWQHSFGSFVCFARPYKLLFNVLSDEYRFALDRLHILSQGDLGDDYVNTLGQHLFAYYLWECFPLTGAESLLEAYYARTNAERRRWSRLFDHIGRSLRSSGNSLDARLVERIVAYFEWRIRVAEPLELKEFASWLDAECMDTEWRLQSFSRVLDISAEGGRSMELRVLKKFIPEHLALVLECFVKITNAFVQGTAPPYISTADAETLLKAGLASGNDKIRTNAEIARENLLRIGRFEFMNLAQMQ